MPAFRSIPGGRIAAPSPSPAWKALKGEPEGDRHEDPCAATPRKHLASASRSEAPRLPHAVAGSAPRHHDPAPVRQVRVALRIAGLGLHVMATATKVSGSWQQRPATAHPAPLVRRRDAARPPRRSKTPMRHSKWLCVDLRGAPPAIPQTATDCGAVPRVSPWASRPSDRALRRESRRHANGATPAYWLLDNTLSMGRMIPIIIIFVCGNRNNAFFY